MLAVYISVLTFFPQQWPPRRETTVDASRNIYSDPWQLPQAGQNRGNRWAEDKYPVPTASKRYHQLKETGWLCTDLTLSSPACSVRLSSHFTVCCSFELLLPCGLSRNISLCSTSPRVCEPLSQCDDTRHPSLCSPSQAAASNSYSACQSLPPFASDSVGFNQIWIINLWMILNETDCDWNYFGFRF